MIMEWSEIENRLSGSCLDDLYSKGYVIVDDFWPIGVDGAFRDEILNLHAAGLMQPNKVQFSTSSV